MKTKRQGRRAQQKKETLGIIVQAAKKLFAEQSFDKTTIRAIAKEANVAVGTVFVHFPDKSALLAATLYEEIEQALQNAYDTLPEEAPIKEQLLHLAHSLYLHYDGDRALARELIQKTLFMGGDWGQASRRQVEAFIAKVAEMLCAARKSGQLPADANCQLLASAFFSHYFMVLVTGLRPEDGLGPDLQTDLLGQLLDTLLGSQQTEGNQNDV